MENRDLPEKDASLDHEPGCKIIKRFNHEWTPKDANERAIHRKDLWVLFAFIRVHSRLTNGLSPSLVQGEYEREWGKEWLADMDSNHD